MAVRFSTMDDVSGFLDQIPKFSQTGAKAAHFSLDHMEKFCDLIGHPQTNFDAVHVAGTNGKGTTCRMLASVYQQAGYKTGLYTSPHLIRFNERIRVDGMCIPDEAILEFFQTFGKYFDEVSLTYFEISTCIAFWYFSKVKCEIAIIETGLGGRLDATNVLTPLVSVITSISFDHSDILGDTLAKIAREKGGIIKQGKPVVTGVMPDEAMAEINYISAEKGSEINISEVYQPAWIHGNIVITEPDSKVKVEMQGSNLKKIDRFNAAIAYSVVKLLLKQFKVTLSDFKSGIKRVDERFPDHANFQRLLPDRDWYFDGAHNKAAIDSLMEHVSMMSIGKEPVFFLSMMKDKAVPEVLKNFLPFTNVYYIDTGTERCADCNQILSVIPQTRCFNNESLEINSILDGLKSELVIFTGSFYFYEQVKHWMANQLPSKYVNDYGFCP